MVHSWQVVLTGYFKFTLAVTILILYHSSLSYCQNQEEVIEAKVDQLIKSEGLAGAVYVVVAGDSMRTFASGFSNLTRGEVMRENHKVHVGSITKSMLALGILRLVKLGKLSLDDQLDHLVPELPIHNPWHATNPITVRHLLDHTAGLSDLRLWHFFSTSAKPASPLREFYLRNPQVLKVHVPPGKMFSYSNMGYTLLGLIIEAVSGQPYEKYLDRHLLRPIGMNKSTFQYTSQDESDGSEQLAMGHFDDKSEAPALAIYLRPAAQFTTTAEDMGKLIRFLLDYGKVDNSDFIDSVHIAQFGKPWSTLAYQKGLINGYALGMSLRDRHGAVGWAHSGNIVGYKAMLYIFPEERKGFFVSFNMDSESADYETIYKSFIGHLDISSATPSPAVEGVPMQNLERWNGYYIPLITKIEPLGLLDLLTSYVRIHTSDTGINIIPFQGNPLNAVHLGNGLFQAVGRKAPSHLLYEEEGEFFLTTGLVTLQQVSKWKVWLTGVSFISGIFALLAVFFTGLKQVFQMEKNIFSHPLIFPALAILFIVFSISVIASHNLIYIGNMNVGSISLYVGSFLLPITTLLSICSYLIQKNKFYTEFGFWMVLILFHFLVLLYSYDLLPLALWR